MKKNKNNMIPRFLSKNLNLSGDLSDIFVVDFLDLRIGFAPENAISYNQYLTKDTIIKEGKMVPDIVYSALTNAQNDLTATVKPLGDFLGVSGVDSPLWIALTGEQDNGGSIVLLNNDILKWFSEDVADGDYYIIPSSVHEVLFAPKKDLICPIDDICKMIKDINDNIVNEDDVLSDSLYYYDSSTGRINIVE